ncbi:PTS sugar transporter subunit IIA [[Enterobacter] lignolyticus]|uniref:PTS IIA-like nitrogen-regulatory protein PtsN n=2 Tax=[Enterobacter] lignolyticus TaxID=1334193 RepID=E3G415_ENTLS|nr:PTS sugar transporter subunit IIA [[Enterobacter] lignolyticus]ADO50497.1 putative PTS IIA-like nitrogen-regulatory protein PtsN [[Enterobacter] lignolyticus SCF1]ALR74868.1 transcriptional regulator [[Enterobacter] lignolyticus]
MSSNINYAEDESVQDCGYFPPQLIFLDKAYVNTAAFFSAVFRELSAGGYVRETFLQAIIERENAYPTGLPTLPVAIALPHTDPQHVVRPFISVTRLSQPLAWHEMGNDEHILQVHFIVLLGFVDHSSHLMVLQKLMDCLADEQAIQRLCDIAEVDDFLCTLKSILQLEKDE